MGNQLALFCTSILIPCCGYFFHPVLIKEIIRDLRILRILHYVALVGLGLSLRLANSDAVQPEINLTGILTLILVILAITYAAIFAIVTNNIADIETDKISNSDRPLIIKSVDSELYVKGGIFCLFYALILSALISKEVFYGILLITIGYYLYSCKPFRLKRIPLLAKLIIGLNSLTMAITGFGLAGGQWMDFPKIWGFYILVPLSLAANFIDLKDIEGDRVMNVKTLPVMWGEKHAKLFIALTTFSAYIFAAYLLGIQWLYPCVALLALIHVWLLYAAPYNEKPIFLTYVTSIFALDVFLFFSPNQFG